METISIPEGLRAQREYIERLEADNFGWDLMIGDAFVRGMRDIGYKSTAFALAELIDNAIQAAATKVDVIFGFDSGAKPTQIAVIDNGHGMEPTMARASLVWGAGTRENNREGFGKYGYGLPSASVSQCFRVTVYSKTPGGDWYSAYLDIDEIKDGVWTKGNRIEMPAEKKQQPPSFVADHLTNTGRWDDFQHGTVVVWDRLDRNRIDYKRREELRNVLITDLGVIFRNFLLATPMTVDEVEVEPCDPLFLTEGFRYYDVDEDRAIELPPAKVDVKDKKTGEVVGSMRVRFARMPATFFRKPDYKHTNRPGRNTNERLEIADRNNGIIFLRNGRQIDVLRPPRSLGSFNVTTDRFWGVEVDFDASLDDLFSITTSKQQVTPDPSVWDILKDKANLFTVIGTMRTEYGKEAKKVQAEAEQAKDGGQRASVEAIEGAEQFRTSRPPDDTPERQREAQDNLGQEARKRADKAGVKPDAIKRELEAEREGVTHTVATEDMPGAPFFRCVQEGGTRVLYLNVAHPFYTELYGSPSSTPRLRAGLEVLLWTLGNAEVDADPESARRKFYERERASVWSPHLADALSVLKTIAVVEEDEEEVAA
jgi:Histidine kinase-, DNA gyrase B-, and HSP90-like ATPase